MIRAKRTGIHPAFLYAVCLVTAAVIAVWLLSGGCGSGGSSIPGTATTTTNNNTTTTIDVPHNVIIGQVNMAGTTDGIKGGVAISLYFNSSGLLAASAEADPADGTFRFDDVETGSYDLQAQKTGWWIPGLENITVDAFAGAAANLLATPLSWRITSVGLTALPLRDITNVSLPARVLAVGGEGAHSVILMSRDASSWEVLNQDDPTLQPLVSVYPTYFTSEPISAITIIDRLSDEFSTFLNEGGVVDWIPVIDLDEGGDLFFIAFETITNEAIADRKVLSDASWIDLTESGKLLITVDTGGSYSDITPPGMKVNDIYKVQSQIVAVGDNGKAKSSQSLGSIWRDLSALESLAGSDNLTSVAFNRTGGDIGCAVVGSASGNIYSTTDRGNTWKLELAGIPYPLLGAARPLVDDFTKINDFQLVGGNGLIMKRR